MKQTKQNANNQVHLYGYLNGVRMNEIDRPDNKKVTAINLDVVTLENYKDKDDQYQTRRTYHDVVLFTDNKDMIEKFSKIGADLEKNETNRNVEGFEPKTHTISVDGILVNKENKLGSSEETYRTLQVMANEPSIDLDVKQAENEVRNTTKFVGNVARIDLHEDKKFAVITVVHHYRPEGSEKDFETAVDVRINGDRKFSKAAYEAIVKGELDKGDFVRMGGQLHNNRYETENGTRYGVSVDLTSYEMLKKKEAKKEEVAKAPAKKATSKKTAKKENAEKAVPKKATPRKKGVRM